MSLTSRSHPLPAALLLVFALAGCTTPPAGIHPFSTAQRGAFMKNARPPEAFGLTVYRSDDGPTFAGSHRLHHGQVAVLDFVDRGNEAPPMVRVMIKGLKVPIPALVDTTSRDNWAVPEMLRTLRGTPLGPPGFGRTADHVLDDIGGLLFIAPTIMLDEVQMENALFYATSNRRHLMPRDMVENERSTAINPDESVEEKVSLSDRFGLWLGFHNCSQDDFLAMVRGYAAHFSLDAATSTIEAEAIEWAQTRGGRSGRVAWQFIQDLAGRLGKRLGGN